jgi:hypothetical protein
VNDAWVRILIDRDAPAGRLTGVFSTVVGADRQQNELKIREIS